MTDIDQVHEWMAAGQHVRVWSHGTPRTIMGEGRVISYTENPTFTIEHADGSKTSHVFSSPVDELTPADMFTIAYREHMNREYDTTDDLVDASVELLDRAAALLARPETTP